MFCSFIGEGKEVILESASCGRGDSVKYFDIRMCQFKTSLAISCNFMPFSVLLLGFVGMQRRIVSVSSVTRIVIKSYYECETHLSALLNCDSCRRLNKAG